MRQLIVKTRIHPLLQYFRHIQSIYIALSLRCGSSDTIIIPEKECKVEITRQKDRKKKGRVLECGI